jgi:hypothetical protein
MERNPENNAYFRLFIPRVFEITPALSTSSTLKGVREGGLELADLFKESEKVQKRNFLMNLRQFSFASLLLLGLVLVAGSSRAQSSPSAFSAFAGRYDVISSTECTGGNCDATQIEISSHAQEVCLKIKSTSKGEQNRCVSSIGVPAAGIKSFMYDGQDISTWLQVQSSVGMNESQEISIVHRTDDYRLVISKTQLSTGGDRTEQIQVYLLRKVN